MVKILIACEESQEVCKAFRKLGYDAYSCDTLECSGGHPEWHIKGNVLDYIGKNKYNDYKGWNLMIAHPPCTYLSVSGLHWNKKDPTRAKKTEEGLKFVQELMDAPIKYIALENPVSCISSRIRKPDQIIQPYYFGHPESKNTCLWLKNLPLLEIVEEADWTDYRCGCGRVFPYEDSKYGCCADVYGAAKPMWNNQTSSGQNNIPPGKDRAKLRSKTYSGIAKAMAQQWSKVLK